MNRFVRGPARTVFAGRFDVVDYPVVAPDGSELTRQVVQHPGAVTIAAYAEGALLLVRQYRASVDDVIWELPAGKLDAGEDPAVCARRELVEETGRSPRALELLAEYLVSPGFCDERMWLYLAQDLDVCPANPQGAEESAMEVVAVALDEAVSMVGDGTIRDAKSMLGVLLAEARLGGR